MKKYIWGLMALVILSGFIPTIAQNELEQIIKNQEEDILELMDKGDIPGMSVIVVSGDQHWIKTFGYKNLKHEIPVGEQTLFQLGSCSKAFTALAFMKLTQENKLRLADNVSKYIPWFEVKYKGETVAITLEQVVHHTSGIPWETIAQIPETDSPNALEQTVRVLVGQELSHLPGETYEYATINYDILALVIRQVTGLPFEVYLQQEIFNKLGMHYSSVGEPVADSLMATGYKIGYFQPRNYDAPVYRGNNAAGYVISNAHDMAIWLKTQLGLANREFYDIVKLTHKRDKTVPLHNMSAYAAGWEIALDGTEIISHAGVNPNFTAYIAFQPEEQLAVAVLANANSTYTPLVADNLIKNMMGKPVHNSFDPGDNSDKTFSIISLALALYILIVLAVLARAVIQTTKGQRKFAGISRRKAWLFTRALLAVLPVLIGIYILPQALAGFTWTSIMVWTPVSFKFLIISVLVAIGVTYITYLFGLLCPDPDKYKRIAPQIILISILSGLANVVVIILVTSSLNTDTELKYLLFYYSLVLGIYLLGRRFVQVHLIKLTRGLVYDLRVKLIDKIFSTSYQNFEKIERGRVYTALNDDINTIGESTNMFMLLITSIITGLGAFIYLASIAFWATVLTILLILTLGMVYYFVAAKTNKYFFEARDERNVFMSLINGMIDGFKEISMHLNKKLAFRKDVAKSALSFKNKMETADIKFVNAFLVGESLLVILLGLVAFGMPELFPSIKLYTLMSFVVVLLYLIGPINGVLTSVPSMMQLNVAWNRIQEFLKDIPANLDLNTLPDPVNPNVESIVARDLKFRYNSTDEKHNFEVGPINLQVGRGEIVFIVGGNGSGKTTFAKLITGLYEPSSGSVMINNTKVEASQLGEYFSTVFSPSHLFKTLYNIDSDSKSYDIRKYLEVLDLQDKVQISEGEYSTIDLSGGQRKRLALLQCYLEDLPIYLFDEWAADQDPEYRKFFYRTLLPEMKAAGKMVIAITHDDHYFDVADTIYKMEQGSLKKYSNILEPA